MAAATLQGLRVLVTRPAAQADPLCHLLAARGAIVQRLPLQRIEPVRQPATAARTLAAARDSTWWIFTSANAVHYAQQLDAGVWPPLIAVGRATAIALERLGQQPRVPTDAYSSEAVLRMPELAAVRGTRITLISGEDGLNTLADTLAARGATVERIAVYRRVALPLAPAALDAALADSDVILLSSGEALAHLHASCDAVQRTRLLALPLVVPSRRVLEEAARLGFARTPLLPEQVADDAYVRCLEQWHAAEARPRHD